MRVNYWFKHDGQIVAERRAGGGAPRLAVSAGDARAVKYRSNTGQTMVKYWSNNGQIMVKQWLKHDGQIARRGGAPGTLARAEPSPARIQNGQMMVNTVLQDTGEQTAVKPRPNNGRKK